MSGERPEPGGRAWLAGLSCVAFAIVLWPFALFGRAWMTGDAWCEFFPLRSIAFREILAGRAPTWVDGMASGYPLLAMGQNAIAYPFTWIYMLDPLWGEQVYLLLPFLLCPAFTWTFARRIGMTPLAALFAALSFTYGGFFASSMAHSGVMQNSAIWLPLMLLAVDAATTAPLRRCVAGAAVATALCLLGGHTQTFVFSVMLTVEYAMFLAIVGTGRDRWKPLAASFLGLFLGVGVCAFQVFETLAVIPLSVRSEMPHDVFASGGLVLSQVFLAFLAPTEVHSDVTPHLCAAALVLAGFALLRLRQPRVWFWAFVAGSGLLIMLGSHGPVYEWFSYLPVLRSLRQAERHAFIFTFALSMLAGYGWDLAESRMAGQGGSVRRCAALAVLAVTALVPWSMEMVWLPSAAGYLAWKAVASALLLAAVVAAMRLTPSRARTAALALLIVVAVIPEPAFHFERWYYERVWRQRDPRVPTALTAWLRTQTARDYRVYIHVNPFYEGDAVDAPNRSAMFLRDADGYEPLYLARYSNALGEIDRVSLPYPEVQVEAAPTHPRSHVLDLLNARYAVVSLSDTAAPLDRWTVRGPPLRGTTLQILSAMSFSKQVKQSSIVADVAVVAADGSRFVSPMRAGFQTAEWAYDRPDVKRSVRHLRARVYRTDAEGGHAYDGRFTFPDLEAHGGVVAVEIRSSLRGTAQLHVDGVRIGTGEAFVPLEAERRWNAVRDPAWAETASDSAIHVYENLRALPRAWCVSAVETTSEADALARIRGYGRSFEPRRTALLETNALPPVVGAGEVRLIAETPSRLEYEVSAGGPTVLVTSELFYPGWEAEIDGLPSSVMCADYLLRSVAVGPGTHRVVMRYAAPAARRGLWVSALAVLGIAALGVWGRRD